MRAVEVEVRRLSLGGTMVTLPLGQGVGNVDPEHSIERHCCVHISHDEIDLIQRRPVVGHVTTVDESARPRAGSAYVMDTGLLILRLVVGLLFAGHGAQKMFGWFGGPGHHGTKGMFAKLGYHPPALFATVGAAVELVGGLLLAVGL